MHGQTEEFRRRSLLSQYSACVARRLAHKHAGEASDGAASEADLLRGNSAALTQLGRELKAPADVISAYAELMRNHGGVAGQPALNDRYVEHIARAAKQLRQIADRIGGSKE